MNKTKQMIINIIIAAYLTLIAGGIATVIHGMFNGNTPNF